MISRYSCRILRTFDCGCIQLLGIPNNSSPMYIAARKVWTGFTYCWTVYIICWLYRTFVAYV